MVEVFLMSRFLTIKNGKITRERTFTEIVDGEILDDGTYGTVGQVLINDSWVDDPVEIANNIRSARIQELKMEITNKKLLDMDCVAEQNELRTLLGL